MVITILVELPIFPAQGEDHCESDGALSDKLGPLLQKSQIYPLGQRSEYHQWSNLLSRCRLPVAKTCLVPAYNKVTSKNAPYTVGSFAL